MSDDFQALASKQGDEFEKAAEFLLLASGWKVTARKSKVLGIEIDLTAVDPAGVEWWIECKGSYRGNVPGSKRGDTTKKAVGVAAVLHTLPDRRPYMLVTSHYPNKGTVAHTVLETAKEQGWFADIKVTGFGGPADDIAEDD